MPLSPEEVLARARKVRAIVVDVDGVLTDGSLIYGPRGESTKIFAAPDGFATRIAQNEGIPVAVLSGRVLPAVRARLTDLGIPKDLTIQGSRDKKGDLAALAARLRVDLDQVAYMGDDIPDLPALASVGLAACPADATEEARERCHYVCLARGGHGAVRELVKLVLEARGRWAEIVEAWGAGQAAAKFFATKRDT